MSEVYWVLADDKLFIDISVWYAQTFTPLYTHKCARLRFNLAVWFPGAPCKVAIQTLKPDGTPDGIDLASLSYTHTDFLHFFGMHTFQPALPAIDLIEGTGYALVIGLVGINPLAIMQIERKKPPSDYPRGKLIKSNDGGSTWDTTDLGDMPFGEYGDPPLISNPHVPIIEHIAVGTVGRVSYLANACIRVSTTSPSTLRCLVSEEPPTPIETMQNRRGGTQMCLESYHFHAWRTYFQKESGDSLYHTFFLTLLNANKPYWITFTGDSNFTPGLTAAPIFSYIHPDAPPFTTIKRPDAPGDTTTLSRYGTAPCPQNYCYIKEASADEFNSCVYNAWPYTKWQTDLYNIPDLDPGDFGPIKEVHLTGRFAYRHGYSYASGARIYINIHGRHYRSDTFSHLGTAFANRHWHVKLNPQTGLPWTQQEINDLQIGVSLYCYEGVGWYTETYCTQLYCKIIHKCEAYQ